MDRIEELVEHSLREAQIDGFKERLVRAARLDLAGRALSQGEGCPWQVRSFADLTRA